MHIVVKNKKRGVACQSKDFNEIRNTHTEVNISESNWDRAFHNWEDAINCAGRKRVTGCSICNLIDKYGFIIQNSKTPKERIFKYNVLIVGDLHLNFPSLRKLISDNPDASAVITMGDLMLYRTEEEAKENTKAWQTYLPEITDGIEALKNNTFKAFPIPVYVLKGNNDTYDLETIKFLKQYNIHYLKNAETLKIQNLTFGILGGIYSPRCFNSPPTVLWKRENRFYTKAEIDKLKLKKPDVLLTHEAASGILPTEHLPSKIDEGKTQLRNLLDTLQPELYIHGHHHLQYNCEIEYPNQNTKVIGLGNFGHNIQAYIKINSITKKIYGTE